MANSNSSYSCCFTFWKSKISSLMGDVAKGIKSFKKGMATDVTEDSQKIFPKIKTQIIKTSNKE